MKSSRKANNRFELVEIFKKLEHRNKGKRGKTTVDLGDTIKCVNMHNGSSRRGGGKGAQSVLERNASNFKF